VAGEVRASTLVGVGYGNGYDLDEIGLHDFLEGFDCLR
jgi:hypothetical protein